MIHSIYLENFRSYKEQRFDFSPGVNWIVAPNARGKTNLLEALALLATGRSFRTAHLQELIREGASHFYLEVAFSKDGVRQTLALSFNGSSKEMVHNATRYNQFTPLIGLLPIVLLLPEDGALIWGAPAYRRRFLNIHISQANPFYVQQLIRYQKALEQRNNLLKRKSQTTLDVWEEMMAQSGSHLIRMRSEATLELSSSLADLLQQLSEGVDCLECNYQSSVPFKQSDALVSALKELWLKQRERELQWGSTLMGPHRDDLKLLMGKKPAKAMASEGQTHSIAAALRLAEWKRLRAHTGTTPLFCIDDFGSHLDRARQECLQRLCEQLGQVFLTAPHAPPSLNSSATLLSLVNRELLEEAASPLLSASGSK